MTKPIGTQSQSSFKNRDEHIPGTHILLDALDSTTAPSTIIKIPTPSTDPDDPLNWSPPRKALSTFCWALYTLINGISVSNQYSALVPLSLAKNLPESVLVSGTGFVILLAGWSLLFWQPFALQYGKRLTYLLSLAGLLGMAVWGPYCSTEGAWYARSVLLGFFAGPIEALPELSVADLYFLHERGRYLSLYAFVLVGGNFVAPVIFGFVNVDQGWRWVYWWAAIFCAVVFVVLFFLMEETNYDRLPDPPSRQASGLPTPLASKQAQSTTNASPKPQTTYLQKLRLPDTHRPFTMHRRLRLQLVFFLWPIPLYAGFAYGTTTVWYAVLNATASPILSSPPYNFSSSTVGLCYLAPFIGTILAYPLTGPLSDLLLQHLALRNTPRGISEPEHRLRLFGPSVLLTSLALLLWGVGSAHGLPWPVLLVAMSAIAFQNAVGACLATNYLVDCYREAGAEVLTPAICLRNTMVFAVSYGISPWITGMGRQDAFITAASVGVVASLAFVPMVVFGKRLRRMKAGSYWRIVDGAYRAHLAH